MKDLAERLRTLAEAIKACEWELPITASEDCLAAAKVLDGPEADLAECRRLLREVMRGRRRFMRDTLGKELYEAVEKAGGVE